MATNQNHLSVRGDRALSLGSEDNLGFREIAKRIANSLVDRAAEDGLVVGIEGTWGSGKSSLLFLIDDELGKIPNIQHSVLNFRPWLIGNRDALITSLFGELSKQLDQVAFNAGDVTRLTSAKAKEAGEVLRSFLSGLSKTGAVIEVAGDASGVEILRLVRSVVDLPNIIYILCYDRDIVSHSIETAVGIKDGRPYLEKLSN